MKIGILSDTHNYLSNIDGAFEQFHQRNVELVVHCGDWMSLETIHYVHEKARSFGMPLKGVLGNNDKEVEAVLKYARQYSISELEIVEGILRFTCDTKKIAVYHGHHVPTRRKLRLNAEADILFLGHSHKPLIEHTAYQMIINPGSTAFAIPRSKTWKPSIAVYSSEAGDAELIFFEKR